MLISPTPKQYYQTVRERFQAAGQPEVAQGQMQYMRNQFEYFGLKMPAWTALAKEIFREPGFPGHDDLPALVRLCMADEHRELHYFGLELCQRRLKQQEPDFINFLEELKLFRLQKTGARRFSVWGYCCFCDPGSVGQNG